MTDKLLERKMGKMMRSLKPDPALSQAENLGRIRRLAQLSLRAEYNIHMRAKEKGVWAEWVRKEEI